jgi:hypothetical protein
MGPGLLLGLNAQSPQGGTVAPAVGALSASGYVLTLDHPIETLGWDDLESLAAQLSGTAVKITVGASFRMPPKGTLTASYSAPTALYSVVMTPGTAAITGAVPALQYSHVFPLVGSAAFSLTTPDPLLLEMQERNPEPGSGAFTGYAPSKNIAGFISIPEVRILTLNGERPRMDLILPQPAGAAALSGSQPTARMLEYEASGNLIPRRATINVTAFDIIGSTGGLSSPRSVVAGTSAAVSVGSGVLESDVGSINSTVHSTRPILRAQNATVWGGGIYRPFLQINDVDVNLDCVQVTIDLDQSYSANIRLSTVKAVADG